MAYSHETPHKKEGTSQPPTLEAVAGLLQAKLALLNYGAEHPDISIDLEHPTDNEKAVRDAAMRAWLTGERPLAAEFRTFLEGGHASDPINPEDRSQLETLLLRIKETPTIH